jgi:thiol-disulfide isomerase/thioredoxin
MPVREGHKVAARNLTGCALLLLVTLLAGGITAGNQTLEGPDIVGDVRAAMARGGLIEGEKILAGYRRLHGTSPEALDALSWLARGALAAGQLDRANQYARETRDLAATALRVGVGGEAQVLRALESAIDVIAGALVEQGARSDAIHFLLSESTTHPQSSIHDAIEANIRLLSLEGKPAPPLESGVTIGPRGSNAASSKGRAMLLFFWAHWCPECKAESPMIGRLVDKYRALGLSVVAPTRRYGYIDAGRNAPPDKELQHIVHVRDAFYPFLMRAWVPVTDANYRAFGVAAIPMHVLIDRRGVVRLYRPGRMTEVDLEAAILNVLAP